jgi:hypothetical protein
LSIDGCAVADRHDFGDATAAEVESRSSVVTLRVRTLLPAVG